MASKKKTPGPKEAARMRLLREALESRMPAQKAEAAASFLWRTWGSLMEIVCLSENSLAAAPGMTPEDAHYLHLCLELVRACMDEQAQGVKRVSDGLTAVELLRPLFLGRRTEAVAAILLDSGKRIIYNGIVCEGEINAVPLYVRGLVRLCLDYEADSIILAHNHPSGAVEPSKQDILTTSQLGLTLGCIQVRLMDHIILTDRDSVSFFESGLLTNDYEKTLKDRRRELAEALEMTQRLEEI